jgi:hypothetical protein
MILIWSFLSLLRSSLRFWEWVEYCATGVVILGCVGEYLAEFKHFPRDSEKRHWFAKRSLLLLIAGLSIELLALVRTSQLTGEIVAGLNVQAEQAMERASKADESAARLEQENLKLRVQLAPRRLSSAQKEKLRDLLKDHPVRIAVAFIPFDKESTDFANDFGLAFLAAKWMPEKRTWTGFRYGVFIGVVHPEEDSNASEIKLLSTALAAIGVSHEIVALDTNAPMYPPPETHLVHLMIGVHPPVAATAVRP